MTPPGATTGGWVVTSAEGPTNTRQFAHRQDQCPRQDSNLRTRLRRPALYPLSYGGKRLGRPRHDRLAAHEAS